MYNDLSTDLLDELWDVYATPFISSHYQSDYVQLLWKNLSRLLSTLPLRRWHGLVANPDSNSRIKTHYFTIDFQDTRLQNLISIIVEEPETTLPLLEFFRAVLLGIEKKSEEEDNKCTSLEGHGDAQPNYSNSAINSSTDALRGIFVYVVNGSLTPFSYLGASLLRKFIFIRGTVIRLSPPRIYCVKMAFKCLSCENIKYISTQDGIVVYPITCRQADGEYCDKGANRKAFGSHFANSQCRGTRFTAIPSLAQCEEVQIVRIQATNEGEAWQSQSKARLDEATELPSSALGGQQIVEVEIRTPFLEMINAGEIRIIGGIASTRRDVPKGVCSASGGNHLSTLSTFCIRAFSIPHLTDSSPNFSNNSVGSGMEFFSSFSVSNPLPHVISRGLDSALVGQFFEMVRHPTWIKRLILSVCPSIFGYEQLKIALLLTIIGGSSHPSGSCMRRHIHLLMVGDPGLGKSQLLRAICKVAPRSALVCAKSATARGLTISLSRDSITGNTTFEAGAVVHGDGGITCIDEIDKGPSEHNTLLEIMEQQTISMAKAGAVFSMPIRTSIIAAGNPIGNQYNDSLSILENVNIQFPLLSRFDFVFIMRGNSVRNHFHEPINKRYKQDGEDLFSSDYETDLPFKKSPYSSIDKHVSHDPAMHILKRHLSLKPQSDGVYDTFYEKKSSKEEQKSESHSHTHQTEASYETDLIGILSPDLLRQFLHYCINFSSPKLSGEACEILKSRYLDLRQHQRNKFQVTKGFSDSEPTRKNPLSRESESKYSDAMPTQSSQLLPLPRVPLPVTPRYLQSLIRVTEARAKLELREVATYDDAIFAIRLLEESTSASLPKNSAHMEFMGLNKGSFSQKVKGKLSVQETALALIKTAIMDSGRTQFSFSDLERILKEGGSKDPEKIIRRFNECGILLQFGSRYVLRSS